MHSNNLSLARSRATHAAALYAAGRYSEAVAQDNASLAMLLPDCGEFMRVGTSGGVAIVGKFPIEIEPMTAAEVEKFNH